MSFTIRQGQPKDAQAILDLIIELAVFEKEPNAVEITKEDLLAIGESIKCKKALSIIHEINSTVKQWEKFANEVKVSTELLKNITKTLLDIS